MKHLEIKNTLAGAGGGGGGSPKPPTLKPPKIGDFSIAASYSYSEIVDLISDGPIAGLTNSNGYLLNPNSYLQALYLNDVPVEVTNEDFIGQKVESLYSFDVPCSDNGIKDAFLILDNNVDNLYSIPYKRDYDVTFIYYNPAVASNKTLMSCIHEYSPGSFNTWDKIQEYTSIDLTDKDGFYFSGSGVQYNYSDGNGSLVIDLDSARQEFASRNNTTAQFLKDQNVAAGCVPFYNYSCSELNYWSNPCEIYTEICPQISNFTYAMNTSYETGVFRHRIYNAIEDLAKITEPGLIPEITRFTRQYLFKALEFAGLNIDKPDGVSYESFTFDQIKQAVLNNFREETSFTTYLDDWIWPYAFTVLGGGLAGLDENPITTVSIPGYDPALHQNLFKNTDLPDDAYQEIQSGLLNQYTYAIGETFYYNGAYYEVTRHGSYAWQIRTDIAESADQQIDKALNTTNWTYGSVAIIPQPEKEINTDVYLDLKSTSFYDRDIAAGDDLNFIIPILDEQRQWWGRVLGFRMSKLQSETSVANGSETKTYAYGRIRQQRTNNYSFLNIFIKNAEIEFYKNIDGLEAKRRINASEGSNTKKYNYSNVLMEFRHGEQFQNPLGYFKWVYIDHFYNSNLIGPFNATELFTAAVNEGVQRLYGGDILAKDNGTPRLNFAANSIPEMDKDFLLAVEEKSADIRNAQGIKDYANWNKSKEDFNEKAQPVTHIVENPNVQSCFITISLKLLSDAAETDISSASEGTIDAGSRIPAPLNIRIEVGLVDEDGNEELYYDRFFQIVALVENPNYMDIGNPENEDSQGDYDDIREVEPNSESYDQGTSAGGIFQPFELPDIRRDDIKGFDTSLKEDLKIKRFIRVSKLSTESNSTLLRRNVSLVKVTEIIESSLTYPFSSIVGSKVDSRIFSDIPKRTFRAKLKKIKIPSNYYPTYQNGKDKRYFKKKSELDLIPISDRYIYKGDWDGTFKFAWSDNPAWVLYDILTAKRYGLGDQIEESQVNKWDLYKIGRFCDAVNQDGYFEGVSDGRGGIEPRFSCNIAFTEGTKIYDSITSISAIFRGIVYFNDTAITFSDDRIKKPIALFTNSNVKEGAFSYSSYKRDEKFNAVEVNYKDRNDDYKTKVEYVENEQDIIERGLFKKEIVAAGITSKAMAQRAAKHLMYQTTKENETVAFTAGNEVLLCKPGDLIIIEDDLRTLRSNYGRVLEVNNEEKSIRTSNTFKGSSYQNKITVYIPTGTENNLELNEIAEKSRSRLTDFTIIGDTTVAGFDDNFSGLYKFAGYVSGYSTEYLDQNSFAKLYQEYPYYTGENPSQPVIWFNTGVTGWVFSTGQGFSDDDEYDKYIAKTGTYSFKTLTSPKDSELEDVSGMIYDTGVQSRRGTEAFSFVGQFLYEDSVLDLDYTAGILDSEIFENGKPQIREFNVTGWDGDKEFGDKVYIDQNDITSNLLQYIPEGSVYRFQAKNATDQVYKIQSIREDENMSYSVVASKYESGKFAEIESEINEEDGVDTFGYSKNNFFVNDINYIYLDTPSISLSIDNDNNLISGSWSEINGATGYSVFIENPDGTNSIPQNTTDTTFTSEITFIGTYRLNVKSLADKFNNDDITTRYRDSQYASLTAYAEQGEELDIEGTFMNSIIIN